MVTKLENRLRGGFCRFFDYNKFRDKKRIAFEKPIMFSGGIGHIIGESNLQKKEPCVGMVVVRLGGPAYRIGLGGGTASSRSTESKNLKIDLSAVQRGDPEMENRMNRVITWCVNQPNNPIQSIHDQGAGGMANVTKEIVSPKGATINLDRVKLGDKSMNSLEIWCSEFQEQVTILVKKEDVDRVRQIADRERCPLTVVGEIDDSGEITVEHHDCVVENLNLDQILENVPQKQFIISEPKDDDRRKSTLLYKELEYSPYGVLRDVLSCTTVGSKRFLTNKVDRSVSGLIVQQQCVGPYHTPISDCTVIAHAHNSMKGTASSIGECGVISIRDPAKMARLTVCEMLTNLVGAPITRIEDIKCSGNWMWPLKKGGKYDEYEGYKLYSAVKSLSDSLLACGIAIDGGKDSLSMSKNGVNSPGTLVLSSYVCCPNITKVVGSDLKRHDSELLYIKFGDCHQFRLGGSVFEELHTQLFDNEIPDIDDWETVKELFGWIQGWILKEKISAIHDISDGGIITTVCEMCMAGDLGCNLSVNRNTEWQQFWFSQEPGVVIECPSYLTSDIMKNCPRVNHVSVIGVTTDTKMIRVEYNSSMIWEQNLGTIRKWWEHPSRICEYRQTDKECVNQEYSWYSETSRIGGDRRYGWYIPKTFKFSDYSYDSLKEPKVAILREEGSNGDREMRDAFFRDFEVYDVTMQDLIDKKHNLDDFRGLVFVGGFSYSDVFGAGQGWAQTILNTPHLKEQFHRFRFEREDTFSLGICNGCQVMSLLGWVGNCRFSHNDSGRFESRFATVEIQNTNCIFFKGMEGLRMGIWCAHGEGKYQTGENESESEPLHQVTVRYVDYCGLPTEEYPHNPNGSPQGVTGVCSPDGRHLAMMPHPERGFLKWQQPWRPYEYKYELLTSNSTASEWYQMFLNARNWCEKNE